VEIGYQRHGGGGSGISGHEVDSACVGIHISLRAEENAVLVVGAAVWHVNTSGGAHLGPVCLMDMVGVVAAVEFETGDEDCGCVGCGG